MLENTNSRHMEETENYISTLQYVQEMIQIWKQIKTNWGFIWKQDFQIDINSRFSIN